ncbi:MAG: hypothetical protein WCF04_02070, partial [Candidatus Nanopelagicales bacterium]
SRTQWGRGSSSRAAAPAVRAPARTAAELHALADKLEQSAALMESRGLADAAAKARTRAAALRTQASGGAGSGIGHGRQPPFRDRGPEGWSGRGRIPPEWPTSEKPDDGRLPGERIALGVAWPNRPRTAPTLAEVEQLLIPDYWNDPDEVDIADWLLAHGYTIQRVRRHKKTQGKRNPDSVAVLGDGRQPVEWKSLETTSVDGVAGYLTGGQATRYIVKLGAGWDPADLERIVSKAVQDAEGLLEEISFITPGGVYRWKG